MCLEGNCGPIDLLVIKNWVYRGINICPKPQVKVSIWIEWEIEINGMQKNAYFSI